MTVTDAGTATPTTGELLLMWDRRRPRSLQTEFGMSELGGCRRRAKYRLEGFAPTDAGGSVQAVMGTVLHSGVADMLHEMQAEGLIPAAALIEHEVHFAGIKGHLDLYIEPELTDTKSTSSRWLARLKTDGPSLPNVWQTHGYAAALMAEGHPVRRINIDYIARDTGEQWRWTGPFETAHVRDALSWVAHVRSTPLEDTARDYDPTGPFCGHCPYFTVCWDGYTIGRDPRSVLLVEDPDAAAWADKLHEARTDKAKAEADEAVAKGALDGLRPNELGVSFQTIAGYDKALKWTVTHPKRVDTDQVKRDYKAAGRPVPMKPSKPTVKLELISLDLVEDGEG